MIEHKSPSIVYENTLFPSYKSIVYENTLFPSYKSITTCGNLDIMNVVTYPSHYRPITSLT